MEVRTGAIVKNCDFIAWAEPGQKTAFLTFLGYRGTGVSVSSLHRSVGLGLELGVSSFQFAQVSLPVVSLQCSDTVSWATGRTYGL